MFCTVISWRGRKHISTIFYFPKYMARCWAYRTELDPELATVCEPASALSVYRRWIGHKQRTALAVKRCKTDRLLLWGDWGRSSEGILAFCGQQRKAGLRPAFPPVREGPPLFLFPQGPCFRSAQPGAARCSPHLLPLGIPTARRLLGCKKKGLFHLAQL